MPSSAIPGVYFAIFGVYEPLLCTLAAVGAIVDPKTWHDQQAIWSPGTEPAAVLPRATEVTIMQLAHVCALLSIINPFILTATRRHLADRPNIQEHIVRALLTPLAISDVLHLVITFYAWGPEATLDVKGWTPLMWATVGGGLSLLIPRLAWHAGVGRYAHARDKATGAKKKKQ